MVIVPIRDLKDTVKIENLCAESNGPVFVTKNGYGKLVVMDINYYEALMSKIEEAIVVNRGLDDLENGRVVDGEEALREIKKKHGFQ